MSVLRFLLCSQPKCSRRVQQIGGFTLIELLVAMILAALVITPLLGFMVNILDTDRKEQAKATSEQEIQTAIDYIARDLQQAVYIYDADGLTRNSNADPPGILNQIPPAQPAGNCRDTGKCKPVLVFWKRNFLRDAIQVKDSTETDDTFVYSLVAYYLIKDDQYPWSKAARIARFEISDGVQDVGGEMCGSDYPNEKYVKDKCPDKGFKRFNLTEQGSNLKEKMNKWQKALANYTQDALVLVDFIDQTTDNPPAATCPPNSTNPNIQWSKVTPGNWTSFYACVDTVNTTAEVFLRGNALARVQNNNLDYADSKKTYFPNTSVRVQGRGYLFTK
ncbi:hormogonium polysaccharide secretion pseudopilin HpsC [Mastigocladopsis repens]|uniref:hormogonium polysaccharide secretion pseudopilin HpsC n=1 Tax=Mastigocladopsis repens TaxID=221287 RepID=UPI000474DCF0|nr:hormogonium polysaccharide secretion pseudopilin HpsC [Mastigocladopsis repens]